MTRADREMDEYGKRVLAPLRSTSPIDPQVSAELKSRFLFQGENLRHGLISQSGGIDVKQDHKQIKGLRISQRLPLMKALVAVLLALIILGGSSLTVYAAQSSLPGEPLYTIKSWSEDVRLYMTFSKKDKLNLTLDFTNRRVNEISTLVTDGKGFTDQTSDRFQSQLDVALQLASEMDDRQMHNALEQIKQRAESQGMTIEELITSLPPQADPAIVLLRERLAEQIQLSSIGEVDPQAFRLEIRERMREGQKPKHPSPSNQSESTPANPAVTPLPNQGGSDNGKSMDHPINENGHGNPGNGQGQTPPGNGNHGPNPTHTAMP